MSLASFVQSLLPSAQASSSATGLPTDYILSQWALETGSGSSNAYRYGNNVGGIGANGPNYYPSLYAGVNAYNTLLNSPRYANVSGAVSGGPMAIGSALVQSGYNTVNPSYSRSIANLVPQVDQVLASLGVRANGLTAGGNSIDGNAAYAAVGAGGSGAAGAGDGGAGDAYGCTGWIATPIACVRSGASYVGYIILAVVVLAVGIWAVARKAS